MHKGYIILEVIFLFFITICSAVSYLIGSISSAVIISKCLYGSDIRDLGSGNAGATNTLRVFGKKAGAAVFFLDFSKGMIAAAGAKLLVILFDAPYECVLAAGFFAQFGHTLPVFFKFKGGKGVATAAGAAFAVMPLTAAILLLSFALIAAVSKTVSLASGICAGAYPLLAYFLSDENRELNFLFAAACSALILIKHTANFVRLLDGNERKFSKNG